MTQSQINQGLLKEVEDYALHIFADLNAEVYIYHNLSHTKEVVEAARMIGEHSNIPENELMLVQVAAWFHDLGYTRSYSSHEEESKKMAAAFLQEKGIGKEQINLITGCIEATKTPQSPKNTLEEVLCDADMLHLAQSDLIERTMLLNIEKNKFREEKVDFIRFFKESIEFLKRSYFTEYAKNNLQPARDANIELVRKKLNLLRAELEMETSGMDYASLIGKLKKEKKSLSKKLQTKSLSNRGVDTMFRSTARKQINLSAIADNKSNILITMNTLIISVVITLFVRRFDEYPYLLIPVLILVFSCLASLVAAILATRPILLKGNVTQEDLNQKRANLLFFGNFYRMMFSDYEKAVREMMENEDQLYGVMIMDQYSQGKVLAKKFRLLRIAYDIFMYGFILFTITFTVIMILYSAPN
jgi:predicted metal-dependent HD superfamily phosphohydrolase